MPSVISVPNGIWTQAAITALNASLAQLSGALLLGLAEDTEVTELDVTAEDTGKAFFFWADTDISVTFVGPPETRAGITFIPCGNGQLSFFEESGAEIQCGLDQEGALHRKSAYRLGPITAMGCISPDEETSFWALFGATSVD
jgi:hypothetical protein